jgi:hypothetical protein
MKTFFQFMESRNKINAKQQRVMDFIDKYAMDNPGFSRWVRHVDIVPFLPSTPMNDLVAKGYLEERNGEYRRANIPPGFYDRNVPGA